MDRYDEIYGAFKWRVPARFNVARACCGRWAADRGRLALKWEDESGAVAAYTFWDVQVEANKVSNALAALGVSKGDRVAIILPQRPETAIAYMAILQMGAIAVPLSHLFGPDSLEYRLENAAVAVAIVEPGPLAALSGIRSRLTHLRHVIGVAGAQGDGVLSWETLTAAAKSRFKPVATRADDPAFIIYTSGTTGPAKGALLGHRSVLGNLPGFIHSHDFYPKKGDMFWSPADWAWTGGLMDALLPTWALGQPLLGYRGRFDAERAFYLLEKYAVRNAFIFPTALKFMMKAVPEPAKKYDLQLRTLMSAGESVGIPLLEWAHTQLNVTINEMFGQTEANYVVGNCQAAWPVKPGSIGRPYPGHRVAIIDADGQEVPRGELGEIAVGRNNDPVMFLEYWRNPAATAEKFVGEWARTGDQGKMDADGYIWYQGRTDDVIKCAGYRIGPAEIEGCLMRHSAVANAAVVGKPDEARGMTIKAFIVLQPGVAASEALVDEIKDHVRSRLAYYEYPREIEFVASLPMTTTGKIRRTELRQRDAAKTIPEVGATKAAPPVSYTVDSDGVGWITFDAPNSRANIFNQITQRCLIDLLETVSASPPKALVIISAKEKIFIVGADLNWLLQLPDRPTAREFALMGQAMMQRLARLAIPVVCAIHGACAGGGYELALACTARIASDAAETKIGLPETGIGIIPGWGGCVRLPRLVGAKKALEHITRARLLSCVEALTVGLIDEVVPSGELKARAKTLALQLASNGTRAGRRPMPADEVLSADDEEGGMNAGGEKQAVTKAIAVIKAGEKIPESAALLLEADGFADLACTEESKQRIRDFFAKRPKAG